MYPRAADRLTYRGPLTGRSTEDLRPADILGTPDQLTYRGASEPAGSVGGGGGWGGSAGRVAVAGAVEEPALSSDSAASGMSSTSSRRKSNLRSDWIQCFLRRHGSLSEFWLT